MTPQAEEAARMLRLAMRDQSAFHALLNSVGVPSAVAFFHAQQSVEKALKSAMCLRGLEYRRTHDLEELAGQLKDAGAAPRSASMTSCGSHPTRSSTGMTIRRPNF